MNVNSAAFRQPRVLLVEDDDQVVDALAPKLQAYGFHAEREARGDTAVSRILDTQPDVVLLDLGLPGRDGLEVCRAVRESYHGTIIALTQRARELDHILALEFGADDFLPKPVEPQILLAHVKAALRRSHPDGMTSRRTSSLRFGALTIDLMSRSVALNGREVALTTAEFDLLWLMAQRAGEVVTRAEIRSELRGIEDAGPDRTMDFRVGRLRRLLGDDPGEPRRIKTVRGRGYLFNAHGWD